MALYPWNKYLENISCAYSYMVKQGVFVAAIQDMSIG